MNSSLLVSLFLEGRERHREPWTQACPGGCWQSQGLCG